MARTKASVGAKVSSGKSSKARCSVAPPLSSAGSSASGDKSSRSQGGGNPVCPRETPKWQKPITNFFICKDDGDCNESDNEDGTTAGSSKPKAKRNVIHSDDEAEEKQSENGENDQKSTKIEEREHKNGKNEEDDHKNGEIDVDDQKPGASSALPNGETNQKPTNHELDETIELEPLNGEDSHKIDEYYSKNAKGKGIGKKTKGKENLDVNVERRNSVKRDLEEVTFGEVSPHANKKVKVN